MMMLYLVGFVATAIGLWVWIFAQRRFRLRKWHPIWFWSAFAIYATGLFGLTPFDWSSKIGFFARDMLVLSGMAVVFVALLRKFRPVLPSTLVSGTLLAAYAFFGIQTSIDDSEPKDSLSPDAELLIQLKTGADVEKLLELKNRYLLNISPAFEIEDRDITLLDDYFVVDVPLRFIKNLKQIERDLYRSGMVDWVEPNEVIALTPLSASITASKSDYPLNDPDLKQLWGFDAMKVQSLYQHLAKSGSKPRKMALIAILDTGVDATHEDIRQNYRSIAEGYDNDPLNHGTHCAGIAAAVSNNGKGIASFSLDNSLFRVASVKVLNSGGSGTQQGIIRGIIEAADAGADVISMSLGGRTGQVRQNAYTQAVEYAAKKGAIVVAAAGNSNRNAREFAPVNTPGVIGVSAIDVELNRAAFSNWVEDIPLALAAPGVNIYSTIPGNKYASFNGTSMATPYVAGLIGLMKSFKPELTAREAWEILHRTGKETRNTKETGRLIQPAEALKALQ